MQQYVAMYLDVTIGQRAEDLGEQCSMNTHSVKYNYVSTIKEKTLPIELTNFLFSLKKCKDLQTMTMIKAV